MTEQVKEIKLRDLQPLLRETISMNLIVENFTTHLLLPPGENYGSTILSVHAIIRKDENTEKEDLFLIAKMSPPTEFQKKVFDSQSTFKKEICMYEIIVPAYNRLEIECGIKENEVFDILPKYYGSRFSLDSTISFDDDAVILLENLKTRGYYTGSRFKGYDYEHSKWTIRAMARFHALGIAMKQKKPDYFEILKEHAKVFKIATHEFDNVYALILKKIEEDDRLKPYYGKCEKLLKSWDIVTLWTDPPMEPWSTIIHADFWVNNIMFHRDKDGRVDDIKFVDFQGYLFLSPLRELIFYLFTSTDEDVFSHHFEELKNLYHDTLISILKKMGCDTEPYSREKFDAQLPEDAKLEFLHLCMMIKFLNLDIKETDLSFDNIGKVMTTYEGNQLFVNKLYKLVVRFVSYGWL